MNRLLLVCLAFVSALIATPSEAEDLMPPGVMRQLGLTQAWARPIQVPIGAQSLADQQLFVHQENPHQYVEIVVPDPEAAKAEAGADGEAAAKPDAKTGKVLVRIRTDRVGDDGRPIGRKEAERIANNQIRRLKRRGIEATLNFREVPRVYLYSIGTDGTLECRDAESGEPIWTVHVGDRRLHYRTIGVSEEFLTVINGANLLKVDAATGEVMEEVRMSGAPRFGALNSGDFAMIPIIGGGVEGYPLYDPTRDPFMEIVAGSALTMPTKAPDSTRVAWGTDRGFVYVMEMQGTPSVLFRLDTDGIVSGRIATANGNRFFFGSEAGQVYGLEASRSGQVLWSQPYGEPFYDAPMVADDRLLIRSTYGNLYALSLEDGSMLWDQSVPNIGNLVAAIDGRAYVTTLSGVLSVLDLKSGQRMASFGELRPTSWLTNTLTDRIYLVSQAAEVQCLRLENADLPNFLVQPVAEEQAAETKPKPKKAGGTDPFGGGADPFGAGADPFGAGGAGGGADPFGGGADPFGGGADAGADPFGGGAGAPMDDPFGGNPFGN